MNYRKVRQRVIISSVLGILCFMGVNTKSEASELQTYEDELTEIYGETSYCSADYNAFVRDEPDMDGDLIGILYTDNRVTILDIEGEWAEIESGEVTGYVRLSYLTNEEETKEKDEEIGISWVEVEATGLNFRTGPGVEYEVLEVITDGTELLLLEEIGNWQLVSYGDTQGYVYSSYTTEISKFTYGESFLEDEVIIDEDGIDISALQGEVSGEDVVEFAMQFLGNPYVWGGTDLINGADCSGFVQSVYAYFGITLPRTSATQRSAGVEVSYDEIQLGDIICYEGHVGIYIGDDQIINAIGSAYGIGISSATYSEIITIRRVL